MQEFTVVQSKSQEHGEWKTSMGLTKFFVSSGKISNELLTLSKVPLMSPLLISYQQGGKYFQK